MSESKKFGLHYYLGSIWTLMIHYDENTKKCKIRYGQDSNGNEVNIFLLVPQYVVITIGEVSHLSNFGFGNYQFFRL